MLNSGWKTCRKSKWNLKIKVEGAGRNHVSTKELTFHLITETSIGINPFLKWKVYYQQLLTSFTIKTFIHLYEDCLFGVKDISSENTKIKHEMSPPTDWANKM